MAKSGVMTPYDQTAGAVEDISALIDALSYEETPALSTWKKSPAFDTTVIWQDFARTAPDATNANIPGFTWGSGSEIVRTERTNITQIFDKVISVSRTQDKRRKMGVGDESAWQVKEQLIEIATDLEKALFQGTYSAGSSAAAPKMRGLEEALSTNTVNASSASLTETMFLNALQTIWNSGGRGAKTAYANAFQKRKIDAFTGVSNTRVNIPGSMEGVSLVYNVAMYASSFGVIKVVLTPYATTSVVSIVKDGSMEIGVFDPFQKELLAKTIDGMRFGVVGEYTLKHRAETHSGKVYGLATA
jgi:hypothetical protein